MIFQKLGALEIIVIVSVAIVLLLLLYIVITVNSFKKRLIKIAQADTEIETSLSKRYELLTKALDIAKKYAKDPKEASYEAIEVEKNMAAEQELQIKNQLDVMSGNLGDLAKSYPELKSDKDFANLLADIKDSDKSLAEAIELYNSKVTHFNQKLVSFPAKIIANIINLKPVKYFGAPNHKVKI
jgi:LemA protein